MTDDKKNLTLRPCIHARQAIEHARLNLTAQPISGNLFLSQFVRKGVVKPKMGHAVAGEDRPTRRTTHVCTFWKVRDGRVVPSHQFRLDSAIANMTTRRYRLTHLSSNLIKTGEDILR